MTTKRQSALDTASELIHGPRNADYGPPKLNFQRIAHRWTQILKADVEPSQVCLMMADLKIARMCEGYTEDGPIDIIGYAALMAELAPDD